MKTFRRFLIIALLSLVSATNCIAITLSPEEKAIADRMLGDSGQERSRSQMVLDPILTAVARSRAADMAKRRYFSHVTPEGEGTNLLIQRAGYELPSSWTKSRSANNGESIGAGYATPQAAWEGWMKSSAHRTHILAKQSFYRNQTSIGIGHYSDPSSPFRSYWVVITAPAQAKSR